MLFRRRTLLLMLIDAILVNLAVFASFYLRFVFEEEGKIQEYFLSFTYYHTAWVATVVFLVVFYVFGLITGFWQNPHR